MLIAALSKSDTMLQKAMSAWCPAFVDSEATVHIVMKDTVQSMSKNLAVSQLERLLKRKRKRRVKKHSRVSCALGTGQVELDRDLDVSKIVQTLVSVSGLSEDWPTFSLLRAIVSSRWTSKLWKSAKVRLGCMLYTLRMFKTTRYCCR